MLKMNLQLFAHKKGVGSTKNPIKSLACIAGEEFFAFSVRESWKYLIQTAWY